MHNCIISGNRGAVCAFRNMSSRYINQDFDIGAIQDLSFSFELYVQIYEIVMKFLLNVYTADVQKHSSWHYSFYSEIWLIVLRQPDGITYKISKELNKDWHHVQYINKANKVSSYQPHCQLQCQSEKLKGLQGLHDWYFPHNCN